MLYERGFYKSELSGSQEGSCTMESVVGWLRNLTSLSLSVLLLLRLKFPFRDVLDDILLAKYISG
jgi:hypothetical protein